jgi:hypothetical protein
VNKSVCGGAIRISGLAVVAATLAGCGPSITYGTGTSPGAQTLQDIAGIAALGTKKKDKIDYTARAPIVAPPTTEALPPPGASPATTASNWPTDPDEVKRQMRKREEEEQAALGSSVGEWKYRKNPVLALSSKKDAYYPPATYRERDEQQKLSNKEIKKMFADARGKGGSYDAEGRPVRKYLTEPPPVYREPDPNSPVEITDKPKRKTKFSLKNLWPF